MALSTSRIDIVNRALKKNGQPLITSFPPSENNKAAVSANNMFDVIRNDMLRMHPWNFATKRTSLPTLTTTPAFEWSFERELPGDFLALLAVENNIDYAIEDNKLLTIDDGPIGIRYIYKAEDTTKYDASFVEAFACKLAVELAEDLVSSNTKKQILIQEFVAALNNARSRDAQEDNEQSFVEDDWLTVRR